tara:strand:- start:1215 stop:1484 length:270 start_codon:yes stop_codon:yes gene_type:complete
MVTTTPEAIHIHKIILDWCSPQVARSMLDDLDFFVAETTDNESLKKSIKMIRKYLYERAEESLMVSEEERIHAEAMKNIEYQRKIGKDE